jgi:antirestriction protein ArdC
VTVFNLTQTEGIDIPAKLLGEQRENDPIADCEAIISAMPNRPAMEQSDAAWYRPGTDAVGMLDLARILFASKRIPFFGGVLQHALSLSTLVSPPCTSLMCF